MQPDDATDLVLACLARAPFANVSELSAFLGIGMVDGNLALRHLARQGLANNLEMASLVNEFDFRWHLTADGMDSLSSETDAMLKKYAVSEQWERRLVRRIDAVEVLYRVGALLATECGALREWYWYSRGAFDAFVKLRNGREFVLMRLGATLSWKAQRSRLGTMLNSQRRRETPPALLVVQSTVDEQRIATDLRNHISRVHMTTEEALLATTSPDTPLWRDSGSAKRKTLTELLEDEPARRGRAKRTVQGGERPRRSALTSGRRLRLSERQTLALARSAKRLLWTIYDWPLMRQEQIGELLEISTGRVMNLMRTLSSNGLAFGIRLGKSPEERQENGTRLCVGTEGLRYLARIDRRRLTELARHWSVDKDDDGTPELGVQRHDVKGTKIRVLVRELQHTDGMNEFVSMLATECRQDEDWRVAHALPPHRWERWFFFNRRRVSIVPDATLDLRFRGLSGYFTLEYEVRADRPSRMDEKLSRYERYYDGMATRFDFDGRRPVVLMVFKDAGTASRFLTYVNRVRYELPMLVSSMDVLRESGITGMSWRSPWHMDRGDVSLRVGVRG